VERMGRGRSSGASVARSQVVAFKYCQSSSSPSPWSSSTLVVGGQCLAVTVVRGCHPFVYQPEVTVQCKCTRSTLPDDAAHSRNVREVVTGPAALCRVGELRQVAALSLAEAQLTAGGGVRGSFARMCQPVRSGDAALDVAATDAAGEVAAFSAGENLGDSVQAEQIAVALASLQFCVGNCGLLLGGAHGSGVGAPGGRGSASDRYRECVAVSRRLPSATWVLGFYARISRRGAWPRR
jgi:hypothetical protein